MYLQILNFICGINKKNNHIPREEGALACVYVCMYVCTYVCVYLYVCSVYVCMHISMYICHCIRA
jgi:hypothetical protein